jgi:2-dehydro-3-deoxyphosphogluconate aldolase/(4S)-4-hydroxy-2-oxoglutarate aldolase
MNKILEQLEKIGIVPVVVIDNAEDAVPLAKALAEGGLPAAEITFRTAAAAEAIKSIREACPEVIVGAGTVLTCEQADRAIEAGSQFIVSPGLNPEVVKHCLDRGVPMLPGCATPSDIERALSLGLTEVKFFPAEQIGGLKAIKAMAAPYGAVRFMPTGGLNAGNMGDYLKEPKIIACGGSFMVPKDRIAAHDWEWIRRNTAAAVELMLGMTFVKTEEQNGRIVSVMRTSNIKRAKYHLERQGVRFDGDTATEPGLRLVEK